MKLSNFHLLPLLFYQRILNFLLICFTLLVIVLLSIYNVYIFGGALICIIISALLLAVFVELQYTIVEDFLFNVWVFFQFHVEAFCASIITCFEVSWPFSILDSFFYLVYFMFCEFGSIWMAEIAFI